MLDHCKLDTVFLQNLPLMYFFDPGQPNDAVVRGVHRHGAAHRRRRQEPGRHEPQQHGLR